MVLAYRVRWIWFLSHQNVIFFYLLFLDLTSTFTVIFCMTRFYIWKNKRRFIVRLFFRLLFFSLSQVFEKIAFTITMYEYEATIQTLWKHAMGSFRFVSFVLGITLLLHCFFLHIPDFAHDHPEYIAKDNSLGFMLRDDGKTYNLCHCSYHPSILSIRPSI